MAIFQIQIREIMEDILMPSWKFYILKIMQEKLSKSSHRMIDGLNNRLKFLTIIFPPAAPD